MTNIVQQQPDNQTFLVSVPCSCWLIPYCPLCMAAVDSTTPWDSSSSVRPHMPSFKRVHTDRSLLYTLPGGEPRIRLQMASRATRMLCTPHRLKLRHVQAVHPWAK
jgi:hypothetical protein